MDNYRVIDGILHIDDSAQNVSCPNMGITGIVFTGTAPQLRALTLTDNPITDISPVNICKQLEVLGITGTQVKDFDVFPDLPAMEIVYAKNVVAASVMPLHYCNKLRIASLDQRIPDVGTLSSKENLDLYVA